MWAIPPTAAADRLVADSIEKKGACPYSLSALDDHRLVHTVDSVHFSGHYPSEELGSASFPSRRPRDQRSPGSRR